MECFDRFVEIMRLLVSENGCPWDRVQTHESLKPCMLEESYEVIDAINNKNSAELCEELGDVMLQAVIHSVIAEKNGEFTLEDTINGVSNKMINRHPHIFGGDNSSTIEELNAGWDEIKKKEKGLGTRSETMRAVAKAMPALVRGQKVIKKSKGKKKENIDLSFEFAITNLKNLRNTENVNKDEQMEIIGKILMAIINISNFFEINAEFSLTNALETYITKFEDFENMSSAVGKTIEDTGLEEGDIFINSL